MRGGISLKNAALLRSMPQLKTEVIGGIRRESKTNFLIK